VYTYMCVVHTAVGGCGTRGWSLVGGAPAYGSSLAQVVDKGRVQLRDDRPVLSHHDHGAHCPVSTGAGHLPQVFPGDHLHWLQQVQGTQTASLQSAQLVS